MPELPEVETIRRYLDTVLPGRQINDVKRLDARMVKRSQLSTAEMCQKMTGLTIRAVSREGKFLFLRFGSHDALLLHLGMSGRLVTTSPDEPYRPHTHLVLGLQDLELRLVDPRRFGRIAWVGLDGSNRLSLGVDPLSRRFGQAALGAIMAGRSCAIKSALLNQSLIAGLGNIYADESLFLAGVHPLRLAGSLSAEEVGRLARAIPKVLRLALRNRGTSFSDYVDALGHPGQNQQFLNVYGREGLDCPRCHTPISRLVIGGRSSHFCGQCQPEANSKGAAVHLSFEGGASHAKV